MFYGAIVWDPWLIISQIVTLQCLFYLTLGFFMTILVGFRVSKLSLLYFFDFSTLTASTITGWCAILSFLLSSVAGAGYMLHLIGRAKKCLDFSVTLYIIHLCICVIYGGWPSSFTWWVVTLTSLALMALLGEWLCIRREMQEIPITRLRARKMNIEVHYGGVFKYTTSGRQYVSGQCKVIEDFDTDTMSWFELRYMLKQFGVTTDYRVHCLRPHETLNNTLEKVETDDDVLRILGYLDLDQNIVLYIEHLKAGSDKDMLLPEYCLADKEDSIQKEGVPHVTEKDAAISMVQMSKPILKSDQGRGEGRSEGRGSGRGEGSRGSRKSRGTGMGASQIGETNMRASGTGTSQQTG